MRGGGSSGRVVRRVALDAVDTLLSHPRNDGVVFSRAHECFYVNDKGYARRCKGLTRPLRSAFFPDFDYEQSRRAAALAAPESAARHRMVAGSNALLSWESVLSGRVDPTAGNRNAGINRGKVTHEQLCDYVTLGREGFLQKYARDGIFECTHSIIEALIGWGVEPVSAEFPIYDHVLNYSTCIDLVACVHHQSPVDQNGCSPGRYRKLVLIEIKTGYGGGCFESGTHEMRMPPEVPVLMDAPMNQALLQVLMARLTLKHCYGISDSECWVVHADKGTVRRYRMTPYLSYYEDVIYAHAHRAFNGPPPPAPSAPAKRKGAATTKKAVAKGRRNGPATTQKKGGGGKKTKGKGRKGATSKKKMVSGLILEARGRRV